VFHDDGGAELFWMSPTPDPQQQPHQAPRHQQERQQQQQRPPRPPIRRFASAADEERLLAPTPADQEPSTWTQLRDFFGPNQTSRDAAIQTTAAPIDPQTSCHDIAPDNILGATLRFVFGHTVVTHHPAVLGGTILCTSACALASGLLGVATTGATLSLTATWAAIKLATNAVATAHGFHYTWAIALHTGLFFACAAYQLQRWIMSREVWNATGAHSAQTRSLANHMWNTWLVTWAFAAFCHRPESMSLYVYFYTNPLLAAPLLFITAKLTLCFAAAGFNAVTNPLASVKALPQALLAVCDPTTFTKNFNLWAKLQVDTWYSLDAYATLSRTRTGLMVTMDASSFWLVLTYLDPWTKSILGNLPATALAISQHAAICALYIVPFGYTILISAVTHFIEQTGNIALIALAFIVPGVLLFLLTLISSTAQNFQSAISPQCRKLYWYSVFGLLVLLLVIEMMERLLTPVACSLNPLSWHVCFLGPLSGSPANLDPENAHSLTNVTKSAYLAFAQAISTFRAQPDFQPEAIAWAHNNLPAALLVPAAPTLPAPPVG
jgi:hypothetical protein